jgi:uncharacterized membrane protein YdfJ with MMPL/SSD domain
MKAALERLAIRIARRPRVAILTVVSLGIAAGAIGIPLVDELRFSSSDLETRGSESVRAATAIERATGAAPAPTIFALLRTHFPVRSPADQSYILALAHTLEGQPDIAKVASFPQASLIEKVDLEPYFFAANGRWTLIAAAARSGVQRTARASALATALTDAFPPDSGVTLGGSTIVDEELGAVTREDLERAELWVLPLLALLLMAIFRRALAATLPLLIGVLTVLETFAVLRLLSAAGVQVSLFSLPAATGLSLGLGIDYSLLGVSRFREEAVRHDSSTDAAIATLATAGRTIVFSAATIACCMAVLMVIPIPLVFSVGLAVSICACLAAANAVILLPAVGVSSGERLRSRPRRAKPTISVGDAWFRLSSLVTRRPWPIAIAVAATLIALGLPALGLRFHGVDVNMLPPGAGARKAASILEREFEPSVNDEILSLLIHAPRPPGGERTVAKYEEAVARTAGVNNVNTVRQIGAELWELNVLSSGPRLSPASIALVKRLRGGSHGLRVEVASPSSSFLDEQASLRGELIVIIVVIALGTYALLFSMTKSILLPLKTVMMSGLTFAATFGLLALIFQREPLMGVLAAANHGDMELTQPILMLSAVFGLSTDYSVFVISRIQEERHAGRDDRSAIAVGLSRSGPVVTSAAFVFCVTIAAFASSSVALIRETAAGMAIAVLIDATLVRALLLPAAMALLGPYNWWLPRPLQRLFGRFDSVWGTLD